MSRSSALISQFAQGSAPAERLSRMLLAKYGTSDLEQLIAIGLTGSLFLKYYNKVNRDLDRVHLGVQDKSARTWIIAYHKRTIKHWHNDPSPVAGALARQALKRFSQDYPLQASQLAKRLNISLPEAPKNRPRL